MDKVSTLTFDLSVGHPIMVSFNQELPMTEAYMDMHFELELGIVISGTMRRFHQERQFDCAAGDIWLCGPWMPHGYAVHQEVCEAMVLVIRPQFFADLQFDEENDLRWMSPFFHWQELPPKLFEKERLMNLEFASRLHSLTAVGDDLLRLRFCFLDFFLHYVRRSHREAAVAASGYAYSRIVPVLDAVFHSHKAISNDEAAALCHLSRDHFIRYFQAVMGTTFYKFSLRYRLSNAARDLLRDGSSTKIIAEKWGFTDESHLYRLFSRHYGCSPKEYRKRNMHNFYHV